MMSQHIPTIEKIMGGNKINILVTLHTPVFVALGDACTFVGSKELKTGRRIE